MDPLTDFLQSYGPAQKTAESGLGRIAGAFPEQLGQGVATAGAGALIVGAGVAANAIYGAITKSRDFRRMLAFNEDLAQQHKQNPKYINAAFSTLHRVNRQFAGDPMVAGGYIRQITASPEMAFVSAGSAAQYAPRSNAIAEAALGGVQSGIAPQSTPDRGRYSALLKAQGTAYRVPGQQDKNGKRGDPRSETPDEVASRINRTK